MRKKRFLLFTIGALLVMGLLGCGAEKYRLTFDGSGFSSGKTTYAEGETVTVTFDLIATDTDYSFYADSEDVILNPVYSEARGYVFTFPMPAHDVKISVCSRNSMEYDPDANLLGSSDPGSPKNCMTGDNLLFDYYAAAAATVEGDDREEFCLYRYTDAQLILARYTKPEDGEETMRFCLVPVSVLDDCMDQVARYEMRTWENGSDLNGRLLVVQFLEDGKLKRVSSEEMPDQGPEAFRAIHAVLEEAWNQYGSSLDTEPWFCPECGTRNEQRFCIECGLEKPE